MRYFPSSCYPHDFGEEHVELLAAVHLLRGRQGLTLSDRHVQVSITHFTGGIFKVMHGLFERPASACIVVCYFTERVEPEQRWHVVEQPTYEHGGRVVALQTIC